MPRPVRRRRRAATTEPALGADAPHLQDDPRDDHPGEPLGAPPGDPSGDRQLPEDDAEERGPWRRCAITRARLPKEQMIRFVISPDRIVIPDLAARLPGRGIWLSARGDVLEKARVQGKLVGYFARAARGPVTVPPDLPETLRAGLLRRFAELLGLTRRAGQAVAGFQKAREWVRDGRVGLIVQAADGSEDERARLLGGRNLPVVAPLDAVSLGAVFGRDHAVHVAVAPGRLADALRAEAERIAGLASMAPGGHIAAAGATGPMPARATDVRRDGPPAGSAAPETTRVPDGRMCRPTDRA